MQTYRHAPLPALREAERPVIDELRKLESWGMSVNLVLDGISYRSQPQPTLDISRHLSFDPGNFLFFKDSNGDDRWGMGVFPSGLGDILIIVGSESLATWDDPATRRPVFMGGSEVLFDAGTRMEIELPGVVPNQYGYNLELASDGRTVIAVPNSPPDFFANDTSDADQLLHTGTAPSGWFIFPQDGAIQPDLLQITIPSGTPAGWVRINVRVRLENTSSRTGQITLGLGMDGADPVLEAQATTIIPASFLGTVTLSTDFAMSAALTADLVLTVMCDVTGDHSQFELWADGSAAQHNMDVRVTYS